MRILCLHGRGSNNEIFRMQTAPIRAGLEEDFEFVFVQGTVRHTEGNWSLHTSDFSSLPLYTYYNPFDPTSILQTHCELKQIIAEEGPFDGVFGYSGGAALAAEMILGQDPYALEPIFRFAVFVNGASPLRVFDLDNVSSSDSDANDATTALAQAQNMFLRPSALRHKPGVSDEDQVDHAHLLSLLNNLHGTRLPDGTLCLSNGVHGIARWDRTADLPPRITIPTLHIRCPAEDATDPHHGLHLLQLCDPSDAREILHEFGHDFPRGRKIMRQISQAIRECAEAASLLD